MEVKTARKIIRECEGNGLIEVAKTHAILIESTWGWMPCEDFTVWPDGHITVFFYLMGKRNFPNWTKFSYAIREIRQENYGHGISIDYIKAR